MAQVTTYKHKFASLFSRRRPPSPSQYPPFHFLKLPYDVRVIVYSYVDTEPPLSPRFHSLGFYQSCRQIKQDIDEIVHKKLETSCIAIEKTSDVDLVINVDPISPRFITVALPYSAFKSESLAVPDPRWKREVLATLQPLFALHLKVLRIHISQQGCTGSSIPKHDTLRQRLELQDTMRHLLNHVGDIIDHQNYHCVNPHPSGHVDDLQRIFRDGPNLDFPHSIVRTQRICLTWDLRSTPSDSIALFGRSNDFLSSEARAPRKSWFGIKPSRHPFPTLMSSRRIIATGYYLHDSEHLVGEVGLSSPSRWSLDDTVASHGRGLVRTESREGRLVSSRGLGRQVESGLVGMGRKDLLETESLVDKHGVVSVGNNYREDRAISAERPELRQTNSSLSMMIHDFEVVEKMVEKERRIMREEYELQKHLELQMAYLEEGIMIY